MGNQSVKPVQVLTDQDLTDFIESNGLDEVQVREEYNNFMKDPVVARYMDETAVLGT